MQGKTVKKISQLTIDEFRELVGQIIQEELQNIKELLYLEEEYESLQDEKIASTILERSKRFSKGESKGYTQNEIEKIFGEP